MHAALGLTPSPPPSSLPPPHSLSERGTVRTGDAGARNKKPSRFELAEKRITEQRDAKQKSDYRRLLKDRLVALKRKDILEAKKQNFR